MDTWKSGYCSGKSSPQCRATTCGSQVAPSISLYQTWGVLLYPISDWASRGTDLWLLAYRGINYFSSFWSFHRFLKRQFWQPFNDMPLNCADRWEAWRTCSAFNCTFSETFRSHWTCGSGLSYKMGWISMIVDNKPCTHPLLFPFSLFYAS